MNWVDTFFDGEYFAESILIIILIALFIFGSTDLEDVTDAP
ncbi:MAG TPA: hypothetical protein VK072_09290 [Candidatus Avamphibacillus sp.]|nr:hypothetical protein [Candidatus Avamphibacillus sp.]